jgi:hypothetical protein
MTLFNFVDSETNMEKSIMFFLYMGAFGYALCKREKKTVQQSINVTKFFDKKDLKDLSKLKKNFLKSTKQIKNLNEKLKDVEVKKIINVKKSSPIIVV